MTYLQNQIENLIRIAQEEENYELYYETLESITLTGVEYFDLGYKVSDFAIGDTIRFKGIVKGTDASTITSSGSQLMYSIGNDGGQWLGKAQNGTKYAFGSSMQSTISFNEEVLTDVTITLSGNANKPTFTITGSVTSDTATSTIPQRSATPTYYDFPLLFGAGTKSTGEKAYGGDYTIKCGKIYINGTMTKDYIPALDNKMRPCLYDKVTKTFVYAKKISDGTDATSTLTYKRWNKFDVDYIESSGTQYIDTGYKFTNTSAFEITCAEVADFEASTVLCGARNNTDTTTNARIVDYSYSAPSVLRGEYLLLQRGGYDVNENVIYIPYDKNFHTYYQSPTRMSIDDTDRPTVPSLVSPNMNFYIFWQNVGTATAPAKAKIKVKSCRLWDSDTLVRDYKPVVWHNGDTTAVACLYDEVYNKMYQNAGTGSLKAYITNISTTKTNVFTTTGATSGKAINSEGQIINSSASSYSALLPIVGGTVIECVSGNTGNNNYRFHCYDSSGTWIEQSLVLYPEGAGTVSPITGSFTAPINAKYVRVSYATQASSTIQVKSETETIYEVGASIENANKTEYIELDYFPDKETSLECWTTVTDWGYVPTQYPYRSTNIFGCGSVSAQDAYTFGVGFDGSLTMGRRAGTPITGMNASLDTRYRIYQDKYGASYNDIPLYYGTEEEPLVPPDVQAQGNTLTLFKNPLSAVIGTMKIHYFKINENYITVREAIPVKSGSTIGLYDKASKRFFGNSGTGSFTFNSLS